MLLSTGGRPRLPSPGEMVGIDASMLGPGTHAFFNSLSPSSTHLLLGTLLTQTSHTQGGAIITSDDLFSLSRDPGRTLVVGGGYVALECAGFIAALQQQQQQQQKAGVTLLARSILLRGFDRQLAAYVERGLRREGVNVVKGASPSSFSPATAASTGSSVDVTWTEGNSGEEKRGTFLCI